MHSLKINIISMFNGGGLETDFRVLRAALEELGHQVTGVPIEKLPYPQADLNVFFEVFISYTLSAPLNWFVPNPEWFCNHMKDLGRFDLILCRTKDAERIFQGLRTHYLGFTSFDCYRPAIEKDFTQMFHLCGKNPYKGTQSILDLWKEAPHLPDLTVATQIDWKVMPPPNLILCQGRLPEEDLRHHQNRAGIHLCISEAEGFGHCIMEAMSTGSVVVTTNGAPMNEFITESLCLAPFSVSAPQRLGTAYHVDSRHLHQVLMRLLQLPKEELVRIGAENRKVYLTRKMEFQRNLEELLELTLMRKSL
jgi:hypothetical protein